MSPASPRRRAPLRLAFLTAALALAAPSATPAAAQSCRIARVVDGDTLRLDCGGAEEIRARLMGFDTPETHRPRCAAERRAGEAATERLSRLIGRATAARIAFEGTDRYGRALTRLWLDGRDVAALMIEAGLARPYGGGRREGWC